MGIVLVIIIVIMFVIIFNQLTHSGTTEQQKESPLSMQVSITGITGIEYRESLEKAQNLMNVITYIVDDNIMSERASFSFSSQQKEFISIADEIVKLQKLLER